MKYFFRTYKFVILGMLFGIVIGTSYLITPYVFAATFFGETCDGTVQYGRVECDGYFEGKKNADNGETTMYDQPALTDVLDKTALINKFQSFLDSTDERYQVSAAATIDVMLGVSGTTFGNNKATGIQYARDNFNRWATLINYYDSQNLIDWEYNYASTTPFPNSGYGADKKDMFFNTSQTNDSILIIRFRNPDGVANDAFIMDKWCGNVKGTGFMVNPVYSISGNVFVDLNRNGVQDVGETNFQGAALTLSGVSSGSTTSNASGSFSFINLTAGNYTTSITVPTGYTNTTPTTQSVTLSPNGTANFGIAPSYTLSGSVFVDFNQNGNWDPEDKAYSGSALTVTRSGTSGGTTTTNASGGYSFGNLIGGTYTVSTAIPAGYVATPTSSKTVSLNGNNSAVNLGITPIYSITGNIYNDSNKNGVKDNGETNYALTPTITASRGTVTTGLNGAYTISNLLPGTVTISYTSLPGGYEMTYPLNGPPPSFQVTVGPGCTVNGAKGAICY